MLTYIALILQCGENGTGPGRKFSSIMLYLFYGERDLTDLKVINS